MTHPLDLDELARHADRSPLPALPSEVLLELIRLARLGLRSTEPKGEHYLMRLGEWAETHGVEALESIQNTPECDSTLKINHKNHWTIFAKRKAREALAQLPGNIVETHSYPAPDPKDLAASMKRLFDPKDPA